MKIRLALVCVVFLSASIAGPTAAGGVMLSFRQSSPSPLTVGSSGTIDVMIQGELGDILDAFLVAFTLTPDVISPDGGSPGGLRFSASQQDLQLNDAEYVFANKSLSNFTGADVGAVDTTIDANDTFAGYDATDDGSNSPSAGNPSPVDLTTEERLLFRLNLDAVADGTYQIKIASATFLSQWDDPSSAIGFSPDVAGTITVTGATAVPEPSSAVILGFACAFGLVLHRARKQ